MVFIEFIQYSDGDLVTKFLVNLCREYYVHQVKLVIQLMNENVQHIKYTIILFILLTIKYHFIIKRELKQFLTEIVKRRK